MKPICDIATILSENDNPGPVWESMIKSAVQAGVSDVHLTVQREGYSLRYRLDGKLLMQGFVHHEMGKRLVGHVKSVAEMDVAEHRRPTEGRLKQDVEGRQVDLRISVIPTLHGQDLVVRIFDQQVGVMDLGDLGMLPDQLGHVQDMIERPSGLILVSGPSGAGKTTTLYAMLRKIAGQGRKIVTIENPVEYDLDDVNQTQINPRIDLHFAPMLTAILRQDPDVIMVGEIRDNETAVTAVRAANTGHLVLATTHASQSSRAIETMLFLGVHPYFLATSLLCVIAQVLVRRICPECQTPLPETADMILDAKIRKRLGKDADAQLYQGTGCEHCFQTGYHGRTGLFEVFIPGDKAKQMILDRRPAREFDTVTEESEMVTLQEAGTYAAVTGRTTMEELVAAVPTI